MSAEPTFGSPVALDGGLLARLERFAARQSAALHRREGEGRALRPGADAAMDALRPYRPGDDPRTLDWNLLARSERAFVRTARREAGEPWAVLLDGSASMGIGRPSKLQAAVECALAIVAVGLRMGAELSVSSCHGSADPRPLVLRSASDLPRLLAHWQGLRAAGRGRPSDLLVQRELSSAARRFVLGDLFGEEPAAFARASGGHSGWVFCHILAPEELVPKARGAVEFWEPERGERLEVSLDPGTLVAYEQRLGDWLEHWRTRTLGLSALHTVASSEVPFETRLERAFR